MTVLDQGVNLACEKVDAGQQADRAVALVFELAGKAWAPAGLGRQVGSRGRDRLNAGFLVIGQDRHLLAWGLVSLGRCGGRFFERLYFAVDAQNLRHLLFEVGIASLRVVAHLVRLYLLGVEDLAHRALKPAR